MGIAGAYGRRTDKYQHLAHSTSCEAWYVLLCEYNRKCGLIFVFADSLPNSLDSYF